MDMLKLAAVGDIMLGDHPVCFGHGIRSRIRKGESLIQPALQAVLSEADLTLGNLECVLSDIGHDEQKLSSSEMRGDQKAISILKTCGFDVLSVANNHMLQHGIPAFEDTVSWLSKNQIEPVGLYENGLSNVVLREKGGAKIALVGYSLRPEWFCADNRHYSRPSYEQIYQQIEHLKKAFPDHSLVVTLHWGEEYLHAPSQSQIDAAHRMIDCGATVIIGHHPHVVQGVEEYRGGLIAYSLGNFVFDSWQRPTRESALLNCVFSSGGLQSYSVTPLKIARNYAVTLPDAAETKKLAVRFDSYSNAVERRSGLAGLDEKQYADVAAKAYLKYRLECYVYFITHIWKYKPSIVGYSLFRAALRRIGLA